MTELTNDQQRALREVRKALYERLSCFYFTEEMLRHRSVFHLLNLIELSSEHRNYLGQFTQTCWTPEQLFGLDAIHDEAKLEPEKTAAVN